MSLVTQTGHIIPGDHAWEQTAYARKRSGAGLGMVLTLWMHLGFSKKVLERALLQNNRKGKLISVNVFEMVCIIVNMAAPISLCDHAGKVLSLYPVLLNWHDNTAACTRINRNCTYNMIGRRYSCFFVGLLLGTKIGIQVEWISTHLNFIADEIWRL